MKRIYCDRCNLECTKNPATLQTSGSHQIDLCIPCELLILLDFRARCTSAEVVEKLEIEIESIQDYAGIGAEVVEKLEIEIESIQDYAGIVKSKRRTA